MSRMFWLWLAIAAATGVGVYQLKYEVVALEGRLNQINKSIVQDEETIHVLKAEWSYLNQPTRIETLSQQFLTVGPFKPIQFASIDQIPLKSDLAKLPPVVPGTGAKAPVAPADLADDDETGATASPIAAASVPRNLIPDTAPGSIKLPTSAGRDRGGDE